MSTTVTKGFQAKAGYRKAAVWGTPLAVGAGHQLEYMSESLTPDYQFIPDEQITGRSTTQFGDQGSEFHSGDLVTDFRYEGLELLLAQALGSDTVGQVGATTAYTHVMKPAENLEGLFGTLAIDKGIDVWEYTTAKVGGVTLVAEPNKRLKATWPLIPHGLNVNTSSGVNTLTTIANLTLPSNRDFALFSQCSVWINDQSGIALGAAHSAYVSNFTIKIDNKFPTDDVTTRFGRKIDEPIQDGFREITGSIMFSKYASENRTLFAALQSATRKKMIVTFTSASLAGTAIPFSLTLYFPDIQFSGGAPNIAGAGRVPFTLDFKASHVNTIPTGFPTGYTDAITAELVNKITASPLV